jgi:putative flippase GtrA
VNANTETLGRERMQRLTLFLRFALVGFIGFVVDAGVLRAVVAALGINLYAGRIVSFLTAATVTWALNRSFTFRHKGAARALQWARFVCVNAFGACVNLGTYALLVKTLLFAREYPSFAVACGSIAGMGLNFTLMRRLVFR